MSYQTTPDEPDEPDVDSRPWTDGARPHHCGFFVEEHKLKYRRQADGSSRSYWECPPYAS